MVGDAERIKTVIEMLLEECFYFGLVLFFQALLQLKVILTCLLLHLTKFDFEFSGAVLERGLSLGQSRFGVLLPFDLL